MYSYAFCRHRLFLEVINQAHALSALPPKLVGRRLSESEVLSGAHRELKIFCLYQDTNSRHLSYRSCSRLLYRLSFLCPFTVLTKRRYNL
jgi:hypothetical protein